MIKETFGSLKPVIAMVHFPPLPGAPGYDAGRGVAAIVDWPRVTSSGCRRAASTR